MALLGCRVVWIPSLDDDDTTPREVFFLLSGYVLLVAEPTFATWGHTHSYVSNAARTPMRQIITVTIPNSAPFRTDRPSASPKQWEKEQVDFAVVPGSSGFRVHQSTANETNDFPGDGRNKQLDGKDR